jgi:hypothetical protein
MKRYLILSILAAHLIGGSGVLAGASESPHPAEITRANIAGTFASSGMMVTADQVELLSAVTATVARPRLKVVSVDSFYEGSAKAMLKCEKTSICLPFYVVLHWKDLEEARNGVAAWQGTAAPRTLRRSIYSASEVMVRSGKSATLIFEAANIRMTLPVLCLQNGVRGQHIRVKSKDGKKLYMARVIGPGAVTAEMMVN